MRRWRNKGAKGGYRRVSAGEFIVDIGVTFSLDINFPGKPLAVRVGLGGLVDVGTVGVIDARGRCEGGIKDSIVFVL